MCGLAWSQGWEEQTQGFDHPLTILEGQKLGQESFNCSQVDCEWKESSYKVKIAEEKEHEIVYE